MASGRYGAAGVAGPPPPDHGARPARGWDYVMVLDAERAGEGALLRRLRRAGFAYALQAVPAERRVLLKLGLPELALREKAAAVGMELELLPRYGGGFLAFAPDRADCFVGSERAARGRPYFYTSDIVLLTLATLNSREAWGAGLDVDRLVHAGEIVAAFAVHREPERSEILREAVWARPWWRPLREETLMRMKRYLGARVTLYVAFVSFTARYLRGIAALSLPVSAAMYVWRGNDGMLALVRAFFGLAVVFWATYFLEYWKRRNAVLNVKWGLSDMASETDSEVRPQYQGEYRAGFWCAGGFVHLDDLEEEGGRRRADGKSDSEDDGGAAHRRDGRAGARSELGLDAGTGGGATRDDRAADAASAGDAVLASPGGVEGVRRRRVSPDSKGAPEKSGDGGVVIGGKEDDDLFRIVAVSPGVTFPNLPEFPLDKGVSKRRAATGIAATAFFTAVVWLATFILLYYRLEIIVALANGPYFVALVAPYSPGILTGLLISVSDALWRMASVSITRWENHRTNKSHNNSLILKRFAFQFVSNYSSLFYIAFVKPHTSGDPCLVGRDGSTPDCMAELQNMLIGMVLIKATVMQVVEVGMPYAMGRFSLHLQREAQESLAEDLSSEEHERLVATGAIVDEDDNKYLNQSNLAPPYQTLDDFGELVISYGYFCLFGLAWPLAAVVQWLDLTVETRTDVFKIVAVAKMSNAADAGDIGMWLPIMEFLRTASIVTNAVLVVFTGDSLDDIYPEGWNSNPVLVFLVIEHLLLGVKWLISALVNEVPGRTRRLLARQEFLIARWFDAGWKPHFRGNDPKLLLTDEVLDDHVS